MSEPPLFRHYSYIKCCLLELFKTGRPSEVDAGYLEVKEVISLVTVIKDFVRRLTQIEVEKSRLFLEIIRLACSTGNPNDPRRLEFLDEDRFHKVAQASVFTVGGAAAPRITANDAGRYPFLAESFSNYSQVRAPVPWTDGRNLWGLREYLATQYQVRAALEWQALRNCFPAFWVF